MVVDHLGTKYESVKKLCERYNVPVNVFRYRMRSKWGLKKSLTSTAQAPKNLDHLGNRYKTEEDMFHTYGLVRDAYESRKALGWPLEDVLMKPLILG